MKISCQSCSAKYTIADDKVRGKTVKIKCKKCGASIVVGPDSAEGADASGVPSGAGAVSAGASASAGGSGEWLVNLGEGDQRSLSVAQISELYQQGAISDETYLWREGMGDWQPLRSIPEVAAGLPAAAPPAPPPDEMDDALPTTMAPIGALNLGGFGAPKAAPAPAAGAAPRPAAGAPAAARRADAPRNSRDLFTPSAPAPEEDDPVTRIGSTSELSAGPAFTPMGSGSGPARRAPAGPALMGANGDDASGIIDIRKLQGALGAKKDEKKKDEKIDDIMNIGGGAMFSSPMAPPDFNALAPPDFNAPPPPEPEPPKPVVASPTPGVAPLPVPVEQPKKGKGLFVALGAVAILVVGIGGGMAIMGSKAKKEEAEKTAAAATADKKDPDPGKVADAKTADTAKPDEKKADTDAVKPADTAKAAEADPVPGKELTPEEKKRRDDAFKKRKEDEEKKKKDEEDKKRKEEEDKKKKEAEAAAAAAAAANPAAGGGDKPFDRASANSALSSIAAGAGSCKKGDGPTGSGRISVTFAPSGNATTANIEGPPFAGTSVGSCVASRFRGAKVPPFAGNPTTVKKTFTIN